MLILLLVTLYLILDYRLRTETVDILASWVRDTLEYSAATLLNPTLSPLSVTCDYCLTIFILMYIVFKIFWEGPTRAISVLKGVGAFYGPSTNIVQHRFTLMFNCSPPCDIPPQDAARIKISNLLAPSGSSIKLLSLTLIRNFLFPPICSWRASMEKAD